MTEGMMGHCPVEALPLLSHFSLLLTSACHPHSRRTHCHNTTMTNYDSDKVGVVAGTTAAHDRPPSPPSTRLVKAEAPPLPQSNKQAKPTQLTRIQRAHMIANRNVKVYG